MVMAPALLTITSFGLALGGLWEIIEWFLGVGQTYTAIVVDLMIDFGRALGAGVLSAWAIRQ